MSVGMAPVSRRRFLSGALLSSVALVQASAQQQVDSLSGRGSAGTLRDPYSAGRPRDPATAADNDAVVKAAEQRLQCTCGCTLDIFTCRTTDFTCTYSPALHKEVLALRADGKSADEIVAAFVAKYGEKALMAPKPQGFNLAGYLVPGILILLTAIAMFFLLRRRAGRVALAEAGHGGAEPAAAPYIVRPGAGDDAQAPTEAELERLKAELSELER